MAYSSATFIIGVLLLAGFAATMAAPGTWDTKHVYTDSVAEGQLSPPRRIRVCKCFIQFDPETNKTEYYCTEDSDPRCRQLSPGELTVVQEKALHQALASKVEEKIHQCVCYLDVQGEANTLDFACNNPLCYQLLAKKEMASANNYPHFECQPNERHPTDVCCRCIDYHWECNMQKQWCGRQISRCPQQLQVTVAGECCPRCLQAQYTPVQSSPSAHTNQGSAPNKQDNINTLQSCECSVCKYTDDTTGELQIKISQTDPECQCDFQFQIKYPYDDLVTCLPNERAATMKAYSDKLAKELAYVAKWSG